MIVVRCAVTRGKTIANQQSVTEAAEAVGVNAMQARIRIIKRGAQNSPSDLSINPVAKSDGERERETVNTVKAWIADWHERKRSSQNAANSMIRSMGTRREGPTKAVPVLN
jgi:hypothetical protein